MSIQEIEAAITRLPAQELAELMTWMADHQAQRWDEQVEDDLEAGRLDRLLDEVDGEIDAGLSQPL